MSVGIVLTVLTEMTVTTVMTVMTLVTVVTVLTVVTVVTVVKEETKQISSLKKHIFFSKTCFHQEKFTKFALNKSNCDQTQKLQS